MRKIDLIGRRFGRLVVAKEAAIRQAKKIVWRCMCDCGMSVDVDGGALRRGNTKSCGCLRVEVSANKSHKHGGVGSPEYRTWESMKKRCLDTNSKSYPRYGGSGISICDRWLDFSNFLLDMGERPLGAWIDRIDNLKGYEPGNCRWATPKEQQRNRTNNKLITLSGVIKTQSQWAEATGLTDATISKRLSRGWNVERAITEGTQQ